MVLIDMPLPERCLTCPCSYWVQFGKYEGRMMCNAMEAKHQSIASSLDERIAEYLVDECSIKRPKECPIIGTTYLSR